jgi:2,3-bisphosphoglycerate-independent phosphoglycerate mutase
VVAVLVILDGASEPVRGRTSLERAATPTLDALCAAGTLSRVRTVAPWLPAGSESAIPALLGWTPPAPVDRGFVEAAAHGVAVGPGERAWRVDVLDREGGGRAGAAATARAAAALRDALGRHRVHRLAGHRLLVVGPNERRLSSSIAKENVAHLRWWAEGVVPPRVLDSSTTVISARGAAAGLARLMGARVVVPAGTTGDARTDLRAKAAAAFAAIDRGAARVVVHVGAPDEAAHERDPEAKVAAIERIDRELLAPLAAATRRAGGTLRVTPDHGCDPRTGEHDADPVPCLDWPAAGWLRAGDAASTAGASAPAGPTPAAAPNASVAPRRLTERAVAALPVTDLTSGGAARRDAA